MKRAIGLVASGIAAALSVSYINWHDFAWRSVGVSFHNWQGHAARCGVGLADGARVGFAIPAGRTASKRLPVSGAAREVWCETSTGVVRGKIWIWPGESDLDFGLNPNGTFYAFDYDVIWGLEPLS